MCKKCLLSLNIEMLKTLNEIEEIEKFRKEVKVGINVDVYNVSDIDAALLEIISINKEDLARTNAHARIIQREISTYMGSDTSCSGAFG